ncbi:MAG TPA: PH domain-containing protein [Pseudonocardiaceae bacterium]|jgi:putative membrane protein|nr:PH domain-containing protein [Pseudonocardiaceae bacterium]
MTGTMAEALAADWQRLDPRMLAVTPLRQLAGFLPVIAVVFVLGGQDLDGRFFGLLVGVAAVVLVGMLRWLTTRYRITPERVELRSGLLFRSARSIPRDRIRSVDLTAGPVHRVFGLSVVKVGTGEHAEGIESRELTLDAVSAAEADRLRQLLLHRLGAADRAGALPGPGFPAGAGTPFAAGAPAGVGSAPGARGGAGTETELGRLDWSWLRFAPLTVSSLAAVGAVAGAFIQFVGELGVEPAQVAELGGVSERLSAAPLWLGITVLALAVLVIAVLGALLIFVEAWWGFRLVREPGTLRIRRGLLTARSVSLEERRLRGVEVTEPLLIRVGHGARLVAVATGLGDGPSHGRGALLPPAPLDEAHRVAGLVLAEDPPATRAPLRRHPPAALRRRLVRAVLPVLLVAAVLGLAPALGLPGWLGWAALGLLPVTVLLALDAYRNLGHALTEGYLVARHGPGMRRTVALQRSGVIGWTVRQSPLQRLAGLVTLTATTAAGSGAYQVYDVGTAEGLAVAEQAVPGLLTPFLHRHPVGAPVARSAAG